MRLLIKMTLREDMRQKISEKYTIKEDGFSIGLSSIDFNEDQRSFALINDKFDFKSLDVDGLNPIDHVVGSLFKETIGQEFRVIRSGEIGDLDVVYEKLGEREIKEGLPTMEGRMDSVKFFSTYS